MSTTTVLYSANSTATHNTTTVEPTDSKMVLIGAYCVVMALGMLGNIVCITALVISKEYKRSALHSYILHLAISDTLFLMQIPPILLDLPVTTILYTDALCKVKYYLLYICFYSSILFLTVISMDRYVAICCPYSPKLSKLREPRSTTLMIILVWVISLLSSMDILLYAKADQNHCDFISSDGSNESSATNMMTTTLATTTTEKIPEACGNVTKSEMEACRLTHDPDFYICIDNNEINHKLVYINFVVFFCLPFLIMVFTFSSIIRQLRRSSNRLTATYKKGSQSSKASVKSQDARASKRNNQQQKSHELEMRVTKMSIALISTFVIFSIPFHIFNLGMIRGYKITTSTCMDLVYTVSILGFANSALNPYLYGFLGTEARQRLRSVGYLRSVLDGTSFVVVKREVETDDVKEENGGYLETI